MLRNHLIAQGWDADTTHKTNHGIDIVARRGSEHWVICARGEEEPVDYVGSFISLLGLAVHGMEDMNKKYSIALPDTVPFRRLWKRLPALAKRRTGITALLVSPTGIVTEMAQ